MELFMIHTGFCMRPFPFFFFFFSSHSCFLVSSSDSGIKERKRDDKVTVLESEKRAWESSPEAQAIKEALNPWRKPDEESKGPS
ncbi:DNA mismatch repair mutS [Cocos nucifera]|uniref:DNA mismatch repair mutS n=1 Tax=Cocos nucifera TaxID=13894 RepID=A0A8K0MU90_COCNU|nr:DNA mismatch repair mutS [Cocos nucifera]